MQKNYLVPILAIAISMAWLSCKTTDKVATASAVQLTEPIPEPKELLPHEIVREVKTSPYVHKLMSDMTLADKVGEMTQLSIDVLSVGDPYNLKEPHTLDTAKLRKVLVDLKVGSILNCGGHAYTREEWKHIITTIQDYATKQKESGIPVLYGIDAIHGTNYTMESTLFPQQLGQASTWNLDLAKECGKVTAYETKASGIPWTFSPVLDIGRDARWPRLWETYGEDPMLASKFGEAYINGLQGDDISDHISIASCMKHFLGYSVTLRGKDRSQAWIPERQLREYFLPTFRTAVETGAKTVMINSGEMNGIPVHVDHKILQELLRDELGFEGLAVTDWEDIGYLVGRHRIAADFKDAISQAINAGIDMAMVPMDTQFPILLKELVEEGKVPMTRIDESVARILNLKEELGLFDDAIGDLAGYTEFASEAHTSMALAAAEESIILAKNEDNVLPLSKDKRILVVGPNANSLNALNGGWTGTWQGLDEKYNTKGKNTILEALQARYGNQVSTADADNAVQAARNADVIIACIGEMPYTEKPGDIDDLDLDPEQIALVQSLKETGKPIVLVLIEGRPRIVREIEPLASAILVGFLPGNEGGEALTNILFGDTNPSGKFPITYPKYSNDLLCYDHKGTDLVHRDFSMNGFNPQWEFGYGMSYTDFEYSSFSATKNLDGGLAVTVTVTNTGDKAGKEVVQVFVSDLVASITPGVKRLRAFEKIELAAGASKTINFNISKEDLSFVGRDNKIVFEPGEFGVKVGKDYKVVEL